MALIGKIRKNFWFVLILLGLALAAFILMDMTGSSTPGGATNSLTLGNVGGEKISYRDFQITESAYYRNANIDLFQKRKSIWDFYVEKALVQKEADALGMNVSYDELMELQFGPNYSPIIEANWKNPQTGQIDQASLGQFRTTIENGDALNPEFEAYWGEQEKQIIKEALQGKINALVSKSVYTPTWMAEESFKFENTKADFKFVKIPFDAIEGDIELSDADFKAFMAKNPTNYTEEEETRVGKYASFEVVASDEDKEAIRTQMLNLKREFVSTQDDSLFAMSNRGSYSHLYASLDQLPEGARDSIAALNVGEAYGPFEQGNSYLVIKMLDKRVIPDTASARHILRTANRADAASVAAARAYIDSLEQVIRAGADFETVARENSQDPSVATNGGLMEDFTQNAMVREFSDVCFVYGKPGRYYTVTTDYGVHLIKVEDQVFNSRDPKFRVSSIGQTIVPSQQTQDEMYDKVSDIVASNRTIADLEAALANESGVTIETTPALKKNDFAVGALGSGQTSRDMVIWMFDPTTDLNEISPEVYSYTDQINYYDNKYVVIGLSSIIPKGMKPVSLVRDEIETAVLNEKKGQNLVSSLSVTSLEDIANQYGVEVETAQDIAMNAKFVPGAGNEPEVVGAAFGLTPQSISKPIVGSSGVFVVQPISTQDAMAPTNLPFLKNSVATSTKSQVSFKIMDNLKKRADIEDGRAKFY